MSNNIDSQNEQTRKTRSARVPSSHRSQADKFKVLVVDDEPDKRNLLAFAMEFAGYNVLTANDGVEGLETAFSFHPDLIVTDIPMPRMDGYEMARRLRSNPQTRFIPIIMQSAARTEAQDVRRGAEVGALGYLTDPTDLDLLLARARTLLEFKAYLDACEEAAFTDGLTGLNNRRFFDRQISHELVISQRHDLPLCLLILDIDYFKKINDTYGHSKGDEVIRYLANTLRAKTSDVDTVARIGGEEFAVLLPEADLDKGYTIAERLRISVKDSEVEGVGKFTISLGIAEFPFCGRQTKELYDAADAALYEAKRKGRDRVERAIRLAIE